MPPPELPVEILMGILDFVPPKQWATLMLVNKVFLSLTEERFYRDLDMCTFPTDKRYGRTLRCLETLKNRTSAAEAVRSIRLVYASPTDWVFWGPLVASLKRTTHLSVLSFSSSAVHPQVPPLLRTLPSDSLPKLSALTTNMVGVIAKLVPHRPVHTIKVLHTPINMDSIDRILDAVRLSTSTIQHFQIWGTVCHHNNVLPTLSKIVTEEKFRKLVTLDLTFDLDYEYLVTGVNQGFLEDLFDEMAPCLVQLQDLRVVSLTVLVDSLMLQHRSFAEKFRNDIARKLPLLDEIELQCERLKKDPVTGAWKFNREK